MSDIVHITIAFWITGSCSTGKDNIATVNIDFGVGFPSTLPTGKAIAAYPVYAKATAGNALTTTKNNAFKTTTALKAGVAPIINPGQNFQASGTG